MDVSTVSGMATTARTSGGRWRARRHSGWVGSVLVFVTCFLSATMAVSLGSTRGGHVLPDGTVEPTGWWVLVWLVGIALAVAMMWRRRWPVHLAIASGVVPVLLPLDPMPALISLSTVILRLRGRMVYRLGALLMCATFVSVWRDTRGATSEESFWRLVIDPTDGPPREIAWWVPVLITLLLVVATAGIAVLRRSLADLDLSRVQGEASRREVVSLNAEVTRQAERERLAREVHDALGHRLSLLSLHAGALEVVTEGGDERVRQSAHVVREGAQRAMDDLRSLLEMLRRPDARDAAAPLLTLSDVPSLVDESVAAGMSVVSTVNLEATGTLDPAVNGSAYRITQELLTNARRHAPGVPVRVLVHASPTTGIAVEVANYLLRDATPEVERRPAGTVPPGNGLTGIRERAAQHHGEARAWVDDHGVFRAAVHLPWVPERPPSGVGGGPESEPSPAGWGPAERAPQIGREMA